MRAIDVFPNYTRYMHEDADAMAAAADSKMQSARRQKKQAEIGKLNDKMTTKRREMNAINNKPLSPKPIS